jgi:hypothetical protein
VSFVVSARQRFEKKAAAWDERGQPDNLLETSDWALLQLRCWMVSDGAKKENRDKPFIPALDDFVQASGISMEARRSHWFEELLDSRESCKGCVEMYRVDNLTVCTSTNCRSLYCYGCVLNYRVGSFGNRRCDCGGELVG